jgi:hypothetical protein
MIAEFEQAALTVALPEHGLKAGDTIAVIPVEAAQVRLLGEQEIAHARMLALVA